MTDHQLPFDPGSCPAHGSQGNGPHEFRDGRGYIYCRRCGAYKITTGSDRSREYRPDGPPFPPLDITCGGAA